MRKDSIFYSVSYPDTNVDDGEVKPVIKFNHNTILAGLQDIKETENSSILSIKLPSKKDYMDMPEESIVAHLDDQQANVEVYAEMIRLVKENKQGEPSMDDHCENEEKEDE